jgi:hypothetical protein
VRASWPVPWPRRKPPSGAASITEELHRLQTVQQQIVTDGRVAPVLVLSEAAAGQFRERPMSRRLYMAALGEADQPLPNASRGGATRCPRAAGAPAAIHVAPPSLLLYWQSEGRVHVSSALEAR